MIDSDLKQSLLAYLGAEKLEAEQNLTLFERGEMRLLHYGEDLSDRYMLMLRKRISDAGQLISELEG